MAELEEEKIKKMLIADELSGIAERVDVMASGICCFKEDCECFALDEEHSEEFERLLGSFQSAYTSLDVLRSLLTRYKRHFVNTEEK